ncbi:hypothetical protein HIM_03637 [Hirsutella minnesotensis 3608]|uniref:RecQ-mediated genome instability protein 1 n=1 Tax=Hirsutella minnesotensis 3608 TaxID=1043627 RepID=A0A0F7ZQ75_9HYPO|nr:hypothetical protein HIM_03637 [Hirsutella minnesotensis 3608]
MSIRQQSISAQRTCLPKKPPRLSSRQLPARPVDDLTSSPDGSNGSGNNGGTQGSSLLDTSLLPALPPNVAEAGVASMPLPRDVHVQVLDVENLSLSRWEQIEELEEVARGERTRGRQVIRVTADDRAGANATHRLVLQDCRGTRIYAVELRRIDRIGVGKTSVGEKMLLRAGTVVARGTVLLTPETCVLLGGRVETWHEAWVQGRLQRLKDAVGSDRPG